MGLEMLVALCDCVALELLNIGLTIMLNRTESMSPRRVAFFLIMLHVLYAHSTTWEVCEILMLIVDLAKSGL